MTFVLIYNKIVLYLLVMFYTLIGLVPSCHAATNLALGKPYTLSPLPSYSLSAPPNDTTSLTDGKYTLGYFWTQKTTVGWNQVRSVEILIDLEKVSVIDGISFSTARGILAGVYYPVHIAVFVGSDKEHLLYAGDIADTADNKPGDYQTKRFILKDIKAKGRYVLMEITAPKSNNVFCDEIEVFEGNQDEGKIGTLTIGAARKLSERTIRQDIKKEVLAGLADKLTPIITAQPTLVERLVKIKQDIATLPSQTSAEVLEAKIFNLRGEFLRAQFPGQQLMLEAANPWSLFSPVARPSGIPLQHLSLIAPQRGYGHTAFIVTNPLAVAQKITLKLIKMPEDAPAILLYQLPFIQSAAMEYIADPLVPIREPLKLSPGESRVIFIASAGQNPGAWQGALTVMSDKTFSHAIPIELLVSQIALPKEQTLNSVNWGYLDFNLIKNLKPLAANDLLDHHTNVLVVPFRYLQGANQVESVDFSKLGPYLKQHKGVTKILLDSGLGNTSHKTVTGNSLFMDKSWQENFKKWYEGAVSIVTEAGFTPKQLYIYPYDEMEGVQIDDFIKLSTWAKKGIPGIQFYATLNVNEALRALSYLDIAQVQNNDELLRDVHTTRTELWLYDARGPAKSLSPYLYYRMMSWKAFAGGYKGIGFWAYADAGDTGTAWDDFDGKNFDYAVIYEGPNNTIISSRRWEAWRMGIEDYELLTMYAKAKGEGVAKALTKSVLDNPLDTTKADEVRKKILLELE